ncbi:MAG: hypothetical protein AB7O56_07150 [Bauldia sp.]
MPKDELDRREAASEVADPVAEDDLDRVLKVVPRGAAALAGAAVVIILLAWLFVYFAVFLPRGPVS